MGSVPPPACGGLCRLKPAFQAGGAITALQAKVAYTAEKRMHTMTSETVAAHTQPILEEVRDLAEMVRGLAKAGAERDRRLDEHDRKLDVIVARLDGLKLLGQIMIGAYALLITVLIAVFGFLFTR